MVRRASRRRAAAMVATVCAALVAAVLPAAAAEARADTVQQTDQGVLLHLTGGGTERIDVRSDRILQVQYVDSGPLPSRTSLSVNASWPSKPAFTVTRRPGTVIIRTSQVTATVSTATGLIGYSSADGTPLTSEQSKSFSASPSTAPGARRQVDTQFSSPADEGLFGLGQQQDGVMNYKGRQVTLDQYNAGGVGGEIAMPVLMSSRGYGLMWDTYARSHLYGDAAGNTAYRFSSESDDMVDYYFMYGPTLDKVVADYRTATGTAPMFPQWAYGLFQSKDHYTSQAEIEQVAATYRADQLPVDTIVQDWTYWDPAPWGSHILDPTRYPDPAAMIDSLHAENIHTMISVWPKFDPGSTNYDQLKAAGCFYVDARDGSTYGNYYDAYSATCRALYWQQIQAGLFDQQGWDAFWLDASEWEAPEGARAYVSTAAGPGVDYYNAYPLVHTQAVYEGQLADPANTKRVFTLTRSAYAGQQRYAAATWSGDTSASFAEFANQITAGLNFSVSGIPYWSEDIGGYYPPSGGWSTPANNELFTRWFEKAVFDPVFRIHGQGDRELYGDQWSAQTKAALAQSDELRYRLMPYIYSLAGMVTQDDYTIMRPLVMDFPTDPDVYGLTDEYMFGPSILVAPVTQAGATSRSVYLPSGLWYDFWTGRPVTGGQTIAAAAPYDHIPLYVRAGSVIPMGAADSQYASQAAAPTELRVYPGADGSFSLYADSGDTYDYTDGAFQTIPITYDDSTQKVTLGTAKGTYPGAPSTRNLRVVVVNGRNGAGVGETTTAPATVYKNKKLTVSAAATGAPNVGQSLGLPATTPDGSATVTTTVVNVGPGKATNVSTQVSVPTGWTATQQTQQTGTTGTATGTAATTGTLPEGRSVTTSWTVTPPEGIPLATGDVTARTTYSVPHRPGGTLESTGSVTVARPVQTPWKTASSTQASFGQSGGEFAIDAAGADIFKNGTTLSDDYGAIYQSGAAGSESTATVQVNAQENTDPWAKAGLVMRNDLTADHRSAGYVALVVTPANGVSLQWDSDDDGVLDAYAQAGAGSVQAPVRLRLERSGSTYTGSYSTDGSTWTEVGTATVASAAAAQDVGMIATSHSSGSPGLDTFDGFTLNP